MPALFLIRAESRRAEQLGEGFATDKYKRLDFSRGSLHPYPAGRHWFYATGDPPERAHRSDPIARPQSHWRLDPQTRSSRLSTAGFRSRATPVGSSTEFSSVEAIEQCVSAGMGLGLLPEIVITCELKSGQFTVLNWQSAEMSIATHIVRHKDKWMSPRMQAILEVLKVKLQQNPDPLDPIARFSTTTKYDQCVI